MMQQKQSIDYHHHYSELMKYVSMYNPCLCFVPSASVRTMIDCHLDAMDRLRSSTSNSFVDDECTQEQPFVEYGDPCTYEEAWIGVDHSEEKEEEEGLVASRKRNVLEDDPIEDFSDDEFLSLRQVKSRFKERIMVIGKSRLEKICASACKLCKKDVQFKDAVLTCCCVVYCKGCFTDLKRCSKCEGLISSITTYRESVGKRRKVHGIDV